MKYISLIIVFALSFTFASAQRHKRIPAVPCDTCEYGFVQFGTKYLGGQNAPYFGVGPKENVRATAAPVDSKRFTFGSRDPSIGEDGYIFVKNFTRDSVPIYCLLKGDTKIYEVNGETYIDSCRNRVIEVVDEEEKDSIPVKPPCPPAKVDTIRIRDTVRSQVIAPCCKDTHVVIIKVEVQQPLTYSDLRIPERKHCCHHVTSYRSEGSYSNMSAYSHVAAYSHTSSYSNVAAYSNVGARSRIAAFSNGASHKMCAAYKHFVSYCKTGAYRNCVAYKHWASYYRESSYSNVASHYMIGSQRYCGDHQVNGSFCEHGDFMECAAYEEYVVYEEWAVNQQEVSFHGYGCSCRKCCPNCWHN